MGLPFNYINIVNLGEQMYSFRAFFEQCALLGQCVLFKQCFFRAIIFLQEIQH